MTINSPKFEGDSQVSSAHWFGMTMLFEALASRYKFQFPFLPRYTVSTLMVLVFPVFPLMGPPVRTTLSPERRPSTFLALAMAW